MNRGFTVVELLISVAIFVFMTALVVAKYGNFNQSTLLTDTAYDVALALRTAQSYGLSVHNVQFQSQFEAPYGVDFNLTLPPGGNACSGGNSNATQLVLFADTYPIATNVAPPGNGIYDASPTCDTPTTVYTLTRGAYVSNLYVCDSSSCTSSGVNQLDVTFRRPYPEAEICVNGSASACSYIYAEVTIKGSDGSTRVISVRQNGQISVMHS